MPTTPDPGRPASDTDLVHRTLCGDAEAFGQLVDRYKDAVFGAVYAVLGEVHEAQDAAQEAFIQAYRLMASLRQPAHLPAWVCAIARNLARDRLRARQQSRALEETMREAAEAWPRAAAEPDVTAERQTMARRVRQAVLGLSPVLRETVVLHYLQGYTCEQVSVFLGVPVGTVKRRLADARRSLRQEMIDMAQDAFPQQRLPAEFRRVVVAAVTGGPETRDLRARVSDADGQGLLVELTPMQAQNLRMLLQGTSTPRPLVHDLFARACSAFRIALEKMAVARRDGKLAAELTLTRGTRSEMVRLAAGDGLALALRFGAPVLAEEGLLAGLGPEAGMESAAVDPPASEPEVRRVTIDEDSPFALVERDTEGVRQATILLRVCAPSPTGPPVLPPALRTRLRRLRQGAELRAVQVRGVTPWPPVPPSAAVWLVDEAGRHLPIVIGEYEGAAIAAAVPPDTEVLVAPQPPAHGWVHDALATVLGAFGVAQERVVVDLLHGEVYYALAELRRGATVRWLDARPSDALALGLRLGAPIAVASGVLDSVGRGDDVYQSLRSRACLDPEERRAARLAQRRVDSPYSLAVGQSVRFVLQGTESCTWESSDPQVAGVDEGGVVRALQAGNATIRFVRRE